MRQTAHINGAEGIQSAIEADAGQFVSLPEIKKTAILTEDELISYLRDYTKQRGFIADVAVELDVSPQFLGLILNGKRRPSRKLLDKWGIETVFRVEVG